MRTAGYSSYSCLGLGDIIIARAVSPTVRGEYAVMAAQFGVALMVGGMGQPAVAAFTDTRSRQRRETPVCHAHRSFLATSCA
jgi:hypothetical protein